MFSSRLFHSTVKWKSHIIVNQPQGQDGLFTFEFKDNVTELNFCAIDDDVDLVKWRPPREVTQQFQIEKEIIDNVEKAGSEQIINGKVTPHQRIVAIAHMG